MADVPQLLHHMAHIQGEDGLGEQGFQVLLQPLGSIQDDLHRLGRVRPEAALGRFASRPPRGRGAALERGPHFLVDRPMQLAVSGTPQRVHHHHHHFLAVLALIPFFPAFLGTPRSTLGLAAMPLTTARTARLVPASAPLLGQLRVGGRRRTLAVDLNHQDLAVVGGCRQLLHEGGRLPTQTQHHLLDGLGGRRPPQQRLAHQPRGGETHARGQAPHQMHHPRRQLVAREPQDRVQGIKARPLPAWAQLGAPIGHQPPCRFQRPFGIAVVEPVATVGDIRFHVQPRVPGGQKQPYQDACQRRQHRAQALFEFPKRQFAVQAEVQHFFEPPPGFGLERFGGDWTRGHGRHTLSNHGADS